MKTNEQLAAYVFAARDKYYARQKKQKAVLAKILPLCAAGAAVIAFLLLFPVVRPADSDDIITSMPATGDLTATDIVFLPETAPAIQLDPLTGMEKGWDEKPLYDKFRWFTHDGKEFGCFRVSDSTGIIAQSDAGEKLYDVTMTATETFSGKEFSINAGVYAIKDIDPGLAVAVRYEGEKEFCAFRCRSFCPPADLGELIDSLDLTNTAEFGSIYIYDEHRGNTHYTYDPIPADKTKSQTIMNLLEECRGLACKTEETDQAMRQLFCVTVSVNKVGITDRCIWFSEDGHIALNIMEYAYYFHVGEQRIKQLFDELGLSSLTPKIKTFPDRMLQPQTSAAYAPEEIVTTVAYTTSQANNITVPE